MILLTVLAGLAGIGAGWLATAVAHRVPLDQELGAPWVRCPQCGVAATGLDRLPLISYLRLFGKCRECGAAISPRYPVVEVLTGALFAGTALLIGVQWVLPAYLWFVAVTMTLVLTDLDHQRIPNRILYPSTAIAVVLLTAGAAGDGRIENIPMALLAGAIYLVVMLLLSLLTRGGFGMGDVKLAFLLGVFLGYPAWHYLVWGTALGFLVGSVAAIVLLVTRRRGRRDPFPFGPAMVVGAWLALPLTPWLTTLAVGG
jgi:leader peptidase (prepilin peptidase) / N-methyltransferase